MKISDVSEPFMRAALSHLHLSDLKHINCNVMVDFHLRGEPTTVYVSIYTTSFSFSTLLKCESLQEGVT